MLKQKQLIDLVFHGGEEYELVFTINPKHKTIIKKLQNL